MKNKFLIAFMFLVCILFIPSFCSAYTVEYEGRTLSADIPNFDILEGTTDYVCILNFNIYDLNNIKPYSLFVLGFNNEGTVSNSYWEITKDGKGSSQFMLPKGSTFWGARYYYSDKKWSNYFAASFPSSEWVTYNTTSSFFSLSVSPMNSVSYVVYSTFDIKNESGDIVHEDNTRLSLNLSVNPSEKTDHVPVLITSDWYLLEKWNTGLNVYTENQMYDVYMHIPQVENPIRYR